MAPDRSSETAPSSSPVAGAGRPLFITFEGLDGSGKSTHLERLAERLAGAGVAHRVTHEPGGTPLGEAVRSVFLDPRWGRVDGTVELLLVFASRRQHLLELIEPALARGEHVLCDRFTDSTRAYQGAGRGVDGELIEHLDGLATGGRAPDRTLLFDLPAEDAWQRRHRHLEKDRHGEKEGESQPPDDRDRLDRETLEFYRRVRQGFLDRAAREPERFRVIDSAGTRAATEAQVLEALADLLPGPDGAPGAASGAREAMP